MDGPQPAIFSQGFSQNQKTMNFRTVRGQLTKQVVGEQLVRRNTAGGSFFAECEDAGVWPGYAPEVQSLNLPSWVYGKGAA